MQSTLTEQAHTKRKSKNSEQQQKAATAAKVELDRRVKFKGAEGNRAEGRRAGPIQLWNGRASQPRFWILPPFPVSLCFLCVKSPNWLVVRAPSRKIQTHRQVTGSVTSPFPFFLLFARQRAREQCELGDGQDEFQNSNLRLSFGF